MKTVFAVVFWSIVIGTIAGLAITTEPQKVAVTPPLDERAQKDAIARQHAYQEAASAAQDVRRYVENARREHCLPIATLLEAAFCKSLDDIERKINSAGY